MADYPAGVYDLYMKYLNEMDQEGIASDPEKYIEPLPYIFEGDGGQNGGQDSGSRLGKEYDTEDFEALALRDAAGNIKYGLSEEEQALMDRITGKGGFNLKTDYPLTSLAFGMPFGMFGAAYNRRRDAKKAQEELTALVQKQDEAKAQQTLQAQVTQQANKAAEQAVAGGAAPDYGKTQTRSSSGWDTGDPFYEGGRVGYADGT